LNAWIDPLRQQRGRGEHAFLVTVVDVRGSAPRETGAKMIVTASDLAGSIGGGQLEYQCTKIACDSLQASGAARPGVFVRRFPLGANCGQCCGGVVEVLFERISAETPAWLEALLRFYDARVPVVVATAVTADSRHGKALITADDVHEFGVPRDTVMTLAADARQMIEQAAPARRIRLERGEEPVLVLLEPLMSSNFNVAVFGAGHVGSAVVAAMAGLDCNLRWVDGRRNAFPEAVPGNTTRIESDRPEREVAAMPAAAFYLVMTHSHALDYAICDAVLKRGDFAYLGLIGSISKRRRFERLLHRQGMPEAMLERLTCPIGVAGISGKKPEEIAIAVAAELLQRKDALAASADSRTHPENVHVLRP
jgi:xanthine dehydrogenase accessory factor